MAVTVSDVRTALNEIDESAIPDATIDQKIQMAKLRVDNRVDDSDVGTDEYEHAITQKAAYDAFTASPAQTQRSAVDASVSWDVTTYIEELEKRKDEAMEELGVSESGSSAPFFKTTDGIL